MISYCEMAQVPSTPSVLDTLEPFAWATGDGELVISYDNFEDVIDAGEIKEDIISWLKEVKERIELSGIKVSDIQFTC